MSSPTIGAAQLPDIFSKPTVVSSNPTNTGTRPVVTSNASATQGGDFSRLMNLQGRGRELEAKLAKQASGASNTDPAAVARAAEAKFTAGGLKELRELVGPNPKGNARRALAAIVARLEGGGKLQATDQSRINLALAADAKRVDLAGAIRIRDMIVGIDKATEAIASQTQDPKLVHDPARMAQFQQQMGYQQQMAESLQGILSGGGPVDVKAATRVVEDTIKQR